MKSKKIICGAIAAVMTMSVAFSGCGLLSTISEEDMKQTVATVNIGKSDKLGDLKDYAEHVGEETISKRDLLNAFINAGSQYINGGYSYASTFTTLMDNLTNNAVVVQYATAYVLKNKVGSGERTLAEYDAKTEVKDKLEYLLEDKGVLEAKYSLYSSLNSALDSYEKTELDDSEDYVGTDTRSTPSGIDKTVEDYLPLKEDGTLDYGVYTGYVTDKHSYLIGDAGKYEGLDNTNRNTRRQAYSRFVRSIKNNYLLSENEENLTDILELSYIKSQYVSHLQQSVVKEFNDIYTAEQEAKISMVENEEYSFVKKQYDEKLSAQELTHSKVSTFESEYGSFSDTSFVLYAPDTTKDTEEINGTYGTFGYVYNILLPFSTTQSNKLSKLQSYRDSDVIDENGYFADRNELLNNITTTDQRTAWFNGSTDYSFSVKKYEEESEKTLDYFGKDKGRDYLFFKNNVTDVEHKQYEPLDKYTGLYSYNGKVAKNKDGSYTLVPNKLNIDGMLEEFSAYINYVLGTVNTAVEMHAGDTMNGGTSLSAYANYYKVTDFKDAKDESKIDYSKLVYATGKVNISNLSEADMFNPESDRYKVMSAVNELQYAYTTDTGVLSQYIGYTVSAYETNYIKEFEYAAQQALRMGVGAFKVCAGDYGWHLIYVTDAFNFEGGEVYNAQFTKKRVETKGTFENKFYEWIKDSTLSNETSRKQTEILHYYSTDTTVIKYEKAYKDLMELD